MTREEAIKWLIKPARTSTDIGEIKEKEIEAYNMAIEALRQPTNDDWERYSDFLWKEAYERGKQEALQGDDR